MPTYTYQWYRATDAAGTGATAISGATLASYTLTTADAHKFLKVIVTANDGNGRSTRTAKSAYSHHQHGADQRRLLVTGTTIVGNALTTSTGTSADTDGDTPTYTYQWYRATDAAGTNASAITGATSRPTR